MRFAFLLPILLAACSADAPQGHADAGGDGSWTMIPDVVDAGPPPDAPEVLSAAEWRRLVCADNPAITFSREVRECGPLPPVTGTLPGWCDGTTFGAGIQSNDQCFRQAMRDLMALTMIPSNWRRGAWIEGCRGLPPECAPACDRTVIHLGHWQAAVQIAARTGTCWPTTP